MGKGCPALEKSKPLSRRRCKVCGQLMARGAAYSQALPMKAVTYRWAEGLVWD